MASAPLLVKCTTQSSPSGKPGHKFLGEVSRNRMKEHGGAVLDLFGLGLNRARHSRIVIADADAQVLTQAVKILIALLVP